MQQKQFTLINRGMNRDLSVSKTGESSAYENVNIRITARENDTLLSVTNERGNKEINLGDSLRGVLIGWNVLNSHIILFMHDDTPNEIPDRIYRVDYNPVDSTFQLVGNKGDDANCLYAGNLGFDVEHPIESVVYFETEEVQKIYWVDGKNVLRFMNFMAPESTPEVYASWDDTTFDSNRIADFDVDVKITKDNSGNTRPNGITQYLLTYFNKHGQETGYVWMSDIVYLSPKDRGGAQDGTNNNSVTLTISNLDTSFSYFRVYSVFRSTLDGEAVAYLVAEHRTTEGTTTVIDDGAHLTVQDTTRLLYLGSQAVRAGTIEHKDQTLFLGDLKSIGKADYSSLEQVIRNSMFGRKEGDVIRHSAFVDGETYLSCRIQFEYTDESEGAPEGLTHIPLPKNEGNYPYSNQLQLTSSQILTFKGGEKYRFALKFKCSDGTETDAFWIGDAINDKYPIINKDSNVVKRVVVVCKIPAALVQFLQESPMNYRTVQLLIAEATYADRSVKAQGIISPTMFNVWERYNRRTYSIPSWITRIRNSNIAWKHFEPVRNSTSSGAEIQCNYWEEDGTKAPYYQYTNYDVSPLYKENFEGKTPFNDIMIIYGVSYWTDPYIVVYDFVYEVSVYIIKGTAYGTYEGTMKSYEFNDEDWAEFKPYDSSTADEDKSGWYYFNKTTGDTLEFTLEARNLFFQNSAIYNHGGARGGLYTKMANYLELTLGIPHDYVVDRETFINWCEDARVRGGNERRYYNEIFPDDACSTVREALNVRECSTQRWQAQGDHNPGGSYGDETPAFFKKHLMFVDENVVTLDSPELAYNAVSFDNADYNFRIVGAAKQTSVITDYTIDATNSAIPGTNYDKESFSGNAFTRGNMLDGLTAWPLWKDYGLNLTDAAKTREAKQNKPESELVKKRSSSDYKQGKNIVRYWLYFWQHSGSISGYIVDESDENQNKSTLNTKTFANERCEFSTVYFNRAYTYSTVDSIRQVSEFSNAEVLLNIGDETRYYSATPKISLSMPAELKYPILYSSSRPMQTTMILDNSDSPYLYSTAPVQLEYASESHAVISLHTDDSDPDIYKQDILPRLFVDETVNIPVKSVSTKVSGALIPWIDDVHRYNLATVESVSVPVFVEESYSEEYNTVTLYAPFNSEPSMLRRNPEFYTVWSKVIDSFGGEDVYAIVESDSYVYLVKINDVERTPSRTGESPLYKVQLVNAKCVSRIRKDSSENPTALVNVHNGKAYDIWVQLPIAVLVTSKGAATLTLRTNELTYKTYPFRDYEVRQPNISSYTVLNGSPVIEKGDRYFFIGEIFKDFGYGSSDTRYGGITLSAVETNRFVVAGPQYMLADMVGDNTDLIYGNQGDTYFQRWDAMRIKPYSNDATNRVIDITSVMLESHLNLDGRTDLQRGITEIASVDVAQYGTLNPVYSQQNNFVLKRDLDEDFNTDTYRSSITWTMPKADMADVDEWTHITLGSTLKLDGDKGICRALRRIQNSLIAFQDRGISEILYNSRTQLSTQDGVPIEIANSGKVDGKRYITNKYGCINKWSIVEGKDALYFVDSINKAFCAFTGNSITNLSSHQGFGAWFRNNNHIEPWTPVTNAESMVAFYDKVHSDVYLVKTDETDQPCLVYNEDLKVFTSFYSYGNVPMMTNVEDRFVSFKNGSLWLQNEGLFCNFFGQQYDFWVQYRVTPDPYGDKIWTNIDYRADFYKVLDEFGDYVVERNEDLTDLDEWSYQKDETFDVLKVWNEYQNTGENKKVPIKKFRIWRYVIPRALPGGTNYFGLDRIRNPWVNIMLKKKYDDDSNAEQDLMQLHDVTVTYFE